MKTRTIIVTTSSDKRSELERDYGIKTVTPGKPEKVTFELLVPDTSETYKKLSKDPRIQDWSFQGDEQPETTGMSGPKRTIDIFDTYDLKDLKTVLRILGGFKRTIEFYLISDATTKETLDKEALLSTALENPLNKDKAPTAISYELTKKILICMAGGRDELKKTLTTGFYKILESEVPVDSLSFEGFCDILLNKGKENE